MAHPAQPSVTSPEGGLAVPAWRLRREMLAHGFTGGFRGLFLRYRDRVHVGEVEIHPTALGLELELITTQARARGQGVATGMLRDICIVADRLAMPLRLTAVPLAGLGPSLETLVGWYGKAGFVPIRPKDGGLRMGRRPVLRAMPGRPLPCPVLPEVRHPEPQP
ncbi:hypothetical protein LAZ40_04880 [Cereibacter sphaeroides]|uniref:hypothetical protein n=1 Tax=Cereibacter sphaeroides TaxID=1063 RepID=UPI001F1879FB|nr:hypothetical protein [Cereibacter sphaeroides]MCE6958390.1 hypothetical protein [Cereibacter sphaeroides]MCE6972257.1 hypothetical protein [Cereibacter sphaeroides]